MTLGQPVLALTIASVVQQGSQLSTNVKIAGVTRREETVLCQLHVCHTFLTHFYLLKGEKPPVCIPCDDGSVYNIVLQIAWICRSAGFFLNSCSFRLLFREYSPDSIVKFLKCTFLYSLKQNVITLLCILEMLFLYKSLVLKKFFS